MDSIKNIYCIGRNYVAHIQELGNDIPKRPVVFSKPTHALVKADGRSIQLPGDQGEIHYEAELVLRIARNYEAGISLDELVSEMTIGLDLTLRDLQSDLKADAHPWLLAKGFRHSAVLGSFIPFPGLARCHETEYILQINEKQVQVGDCKKMIFPIPDLVRFIGERLGLSEGDLIFTGTPEGVGPIRNRDQVRFLWGDQCLGEATFIC